MRRGFSAVGCAILIFFTPPGGSRAAELTFSTDQIEAVHRQNGDTVSRFPRVRRFKRQTETFPSAAPDNSEASAFEKYVRATRLFYGVRVATYDVDGATGRSFRPEGVQYEQNLSVSNNSAFDDGRIFEWKADFRQAEDLQLGTRKDVTMQNLLLTYARPQQYEFRFGNVFANQSRYTFTRSLQGLTGFIVLPQADGRSVKISAATGRVARGIDNRSLQRYAHGLRAAWSGLGAGRSVFDPITVGVNAAATHDDKASAEGPTLVALDGQVYSVDWTVPFKLGGFVLDGELARSYVNPNARAAVSRERVGTAWRSGLRGAPYPGWNMTANVERVDPDAQSPLGAMAADQFRWDVAAQGALPWEARLGVQFFRSENNVKRQLSATSVSHVAGVDMSVPLLRHFISLDTRAAAGPSSLLRPFRDILVTAAARVSDRATSDGRFDNAVVDENYGLSHRLGAWRYSLGANYQISIDRVLRANDRRTNGWNANISRELSLPKLDLVLEPSFSYSRQRDYGDLSRITNRNQASRGNIGWRWREKLSGGVSYSIVDRDQGQGAGDFVQTTLAANAAYRMEHPFAGRLGLSVRRNQVDDERPGQDYSEKEGQVTFNTEF